MAFITSLPRYFIERSAELIGSFPSNQNTLYLLCLFYSDNEIITVHGIPEICTLNGWFKSSCLGFCGSFHTSTFINKPYYQLWIIM